MKIKTVLLGFLLQAVATAGLADGNVVVHGAWIQAAPPSAPANAGYATIENHFSKGKSLVGASSPALGSVTIHRTQIIDGVARMHHVAKIDIKANGRVTFRPGGYHLMLMQRKRPLKSGDQVPVELEFADGTRVSAVFHLREQAPAQAKDESFHSGDPAVTPAPGSAMR